MPFAIAAAGIGAAGAIGGSLISANAAKSGQNAAQAQFAQQRNDLAPYRDASTGSLQAQQDLLGLNGPDAATTAMGNFQTSPGYQFSMDQGLRAVDAGAAAKGLLRSGATLKAEQTFGTGLADQEFSNYYNRLFDMSKLGETAAAGGASTAVAAGNSAQGAGNTQASIYNNLGQSLTSTGQGLLNNPQFRTSVNTLFNGGGNTPGVSGSPNTPSIYGVASPY